jgi:Nucleotide modification associated domain 1
MNKQEYLEFHEDMCKRMIALTQRKNNDYTGGSDDPFYNFTKVEFLGITDTERGFLTRMFDKLARITTFVNKGVLQVDGESVEDTLMDLANYSILLAGYIKSKRVDAEAAKTLLYPPQAGLTSGSVNVAASPEWEAWVKKVEDRGPEVLP